MKRLVAILCFLLLIGNSVYVSASTEEDNQTLLDVICEPADSVMYEELQTLIDQHHLPGYQVEGKKIYRSYRVFDWVGQGKNSVEAGITYAGESSYYFIFDGDQCYRVWHNFSDSLTVHFPDDFSLEWRAVFELFNEKQQVELCGITKNVTAVTCFEGLNNGVILYLTTADDMVYVRHYDRKYDGIYRDYLLEDFITYVERYAGWLQPQYSHKTLDESDFSRHPFAVYMNDGAPSSPPPCTERPILPVKNRTNSVWPAILIGAGVVLIAGTVSVIVWRRRKAK